VTTVLALAALTFGVITGGAHGFRAPSVLAALAVRSSGRVRRLRAANLVT
jgi:hypothetical protein